MKTIAFSFLLLFTTLTVVVCTYYLWQDADFEVSVSIEEEEEEGKTTESSVSFQVFFNADNLLLDLLSNEETKAISNIDVKIHYEDVSLNRLFSPPDVM